MIKLLFLCLLGLLPAKDGVVLTIEDEEYSLHQFYSYYPKKQWEAADSTKKDKKYTEFIKRQLCIVEAKKQGLESDPSVAVKIRDRSRQLLVNESYEQLVAVPLINPDVIAEARTYAREELFVSHILIGYSGSYLARPPERSIDDALIISQSIIKQFIDGSDFADLAKQYSDDPSASVNAGAVGWVQWGATVPEFQSAAFRLDKNLLSGPVLTAFGYHLILVTDSRPSDYQYMSEEEYESAVVNLSKGSVRDKLRAAAIAHDSLQIEEHGVFFNADAIFKIAQSIGRFKQKDGIIKGSGSLNMADLLESISDIGVVCVYGGKGVGSRWFSNKIGKIPVSRQPALGSEDEIISFFKTIILQDIAMKNGRLFGVDNSFSFLQRKKDMVSSLLYDAYMKHLINSAPKPDTSDVRQYYNKNMVDKYMEPSSVLIREIRVSSRDLIDSLFILVNSGVDFDFLAKEYSLINPDGGGLVEPFSRNKNRAFYDAASLLDPGDISPILSAPGNLFSIILLQEKISGMPLDFSRVYSRIESLLIKESQGNAKKTGTDGLLNKYSVNSHLEPLGWPAR